jgi:hypothetical protein
MSQIPTSPITALVIAARPAERYNAAVDGAEAAIVIVAGLPL